MPLSISFFIRNRRLHLETAIVCLHDVMFPEQFSDIRTIHLFQHFL